MKNKRITKAIHNLLCKWDRQGYSPSSINTGCCDEFAQELQEQFPKGQAIWGDDYPELFKGGVDPYRHCFFSFQGMYYDSEMPNGTNHPARLPYYARQIKARQWNTVGEMVGNILDVF